MKEVEVKILEQKETDWKEKLEKLGARRFPEKEFYAIFFEDEKKSITKEEKTLRLRKEGNLSVLTFKEKIPNEEIKIREETETEVSDFEETKKIIEKLGFQVYRSTRKKRISYKLDEIKIEFDKYLDNLSFIPEFMEIEAENVETIHKYAEVLGIDKEDFKPWTGKDLIKHYKK